MRFTQQEKMEIIRIVEGSELGVNRALKQLGMSGWQTECKSC